MHSILPYSEASEHSRHIRFVDLFCGIGGFRQAAAALGWECVFSSDIDKYARRAYEANYGEAPFGDVRKADSVPFHDVVLAGFPCQSFSIAGLRRGFEDARGTLFFEIARIADKAKTSALVLENVPQLVGHDGGRTLQRIMSVLDEMGYDVTWKILNALDFGLPHNRRRIYFVAVRRGAEAAFQGWPEGGIPMEPLEGILEEDAAVESKHFVSEQIRLKRLDALPEGKRRQGRSIWHENKSGLISARPYSCALRASASYNYLLVDGVRRLTPREMLRLQGFPETFQIAVSDSQARKQAGNSVAVPVVRAILEKIKFVF